MFYLKAHLGQYRFIYISSSVLAAYLIIIIIIFI